MSNTFQSLYKQLNSAQKEAVDAIDGPVMVIAGPGTGKTQILTLRIANILRKTDTPADAVLALTFTGSGVFSMRKRLVEIVGSQGYQVGIFTFHSFCNDVIQQYPDAFPRIIGAQHITEIDKVSLLKEIILTSKKLKRLRPFGDNFFYVNPVRAQLSKLKREDISPGDLKRLIKEEERTIGSVSDLTHTKGKYKGEIKGKYSDLLSKIEKNKELQIVYEAYEMELQKRRAYDYEDMVLEVLRTLKKDHDLLLKLQEEFQYILADEHQDANRAQNELLELLASFHEEPNIFVVGDEKQAIFRFQGATLDNFLYFKKTYPHAKLIELKESYRSTQEILDSAHSLIEKSKEGSAGTRVPLVSKRRGKGAPLELYAFSKPDFEYLFLATDISEKLGEGVLPQEIAVLYRNNRDVDDVARILEKLSIPFVIESDRTVLDDIDIKKFIIILEAIFGFGSDAKLTELLHIDFFDIDTLDIYRLTTYARKKRLSYHEILASRELLKGATVRHVKELRRLYTVLSVWHTKSHNMDLLDFLDLVMHESGFVSHVLKSEFAVEKLEKLNGLFDDIRALVEIHHDYKLTELITYITDLREHRVTVAKERKSVFVQGVRLMTAHHSKGLEFDYVYVVDVHDGHFGNKKILQYFAMPHTLLRDKLLDENDDERRLFYVALTRARTAVSLLYATQGSDGKERLPSQFVEEINQKLIEKKNTVEFERSVDTQIVHRPSKKVAVPPLKDKKFLNELFLEQGMSVTALNNFLTCPWNYFYGSLLRVPKPLNKHLMYGNAIHHTLRYFFDELQKDENIGTKKLISIFNDNVEKQPFNAVDLEEAKKKGEHALHGYYQTYIQTWNRNILNEFRISVLMPLQSGYAKRLTLRGVLDKIEFLQAQDVNVVDYKTGKPKSRNAITGKTKLSSGDYKRQLVFYKLLLELYEQRKLNMVSGEIDFVEPDNKGRYHKEHFEILPYEVEELKYTLAKAAEEILSLSFWNTRCRDKKCGYCALRNAMGD